MICTASVSSAIIDDRIWVFAEEVVERFDQSVIFVDCRKDQEFDVGRAPGAVHLDLKFVFSESELAKHTAKDGRSVIYCNRKSCMHSSEASKVAVERGDSNVHYFRDGYCLVDRSIGCCKNIMAVSAKVKETEGEAPNNLNESENTARDMAEISEFSGEISMITSVIEDLAFQTKVLA